ncbi:hypothetical protein [Hymenobacter daeguensis]
MSTKKSSVTTLSEFKYEYYGPRGTAKREELEAGYENFKRLNLLFGAYQGEETAEELIAAIRNSRVSNRSTELL